MEIRDAYVHVCPPLAQELARSRHRRVVDRLPRTRASRALGPSPQGLPREGPVLLATRLPKPEVTGPYPEHEHEAEHEHSLREDEDEGEDVDMDEKDEGEYEHKREREHERESMSVSMSVSVRA